jgi:CMP-N,N'-diacetyllegionaminic acid synthase
MCLIPARGGSKSIPRKNLQVVGNSTLLAHAISTSRAESLIERTIVSTDDDEITDHALKHGAEVPFKRPDDLSGDLSPDIGVFKHCLKWLYANEEYTPDLIVHLRCTGPGRTSEEVRRAIEIMMEEPEWSSLRSVNVAKESPYKMWTREGDRLHRVTTAVGIPDASSYPRQGLPLVYWQNGVVDVVRWETIMKTGSMTGDRVRAYVTTEAIEVDYPEDLERAEEALRSVKYPV